ncbi:MAG: hypothetical protein JXR58_01815 [Bacteroidales bacterium]|nr:hypothetical protein [Bacteroidales bacterium]
MKRLIITVFVITIMLPGFSQDTLNVDDDGYLLNDEVHISGFGGPSIGFSSINNNFALLMGGSGGINFNNNLFFGGYGSGITNKITVDSAVYEGSNIGFASGGLFTGFVLFNKMKLHPVVSLMVGWGSVSIANDLGYIIDIDNVYVVTPAFDLEYNFADYFRLCIGVYYRNISGIEKLEFDNKDFSNFGGHLTLKFGWFGENNLEDYE